MQKIKSITLRNFKFFYGTEQQQPQNEIELNGNHLLLYGENGSGKSTIYWALYTFLQSCLKSDPQIEKYFDPAHKENLRNRFAKDSDESQIELRFEDEKEVPIIRKIGSRNINTKDGTFVEQTLKASDFLNYKYLSQLYNFRNSQDIDLFPLFVRNVLMFIDFEEEYLNHEGNSSGKTMASDWWSFVEKGYVSLPKNKNTVSVSSDEYKRYKWSTIPRFIALLKKVLNDITIATNKYLTQKFNEDIEIFFVLDDIECDYNKKISQRAKDGKLHIPKIPLKVKLKNDTLADEKCIVLKPHTFLNEARMTAIALSIRFAIIDLKYMTGNLARILVIDDLLLSLDMNHRDVVLDIILEKAADYQLLICTHDRGFYNLSKRRIESEFKSGWIFKEMYQHQTDSGIPCPFIPQKQSYMDLAEKYIKTFDYPAAANYMRKECERVLINQLLPKNLTTYLSEEEGSKTLALDKLILNFIKYYKELGGDIEPFKKLKEYKDLLLNPLSHDNIESPIYKQELLRIKEILMKLNRIEKVVLDPNDNKKRIFFSLTETHKNGEAWEYIFVPKAKFVCFLDLDGNWLISNPICDVLGRTNLEVKNSSEIINGENGNKLKKFQDRMNHHLKIKVRNQPPQNDLKEIMKIGEIPMMEYLQQRNKQ